MTTDTMTERPQIDPALAAYRLWAARPDPASPILVLECPDARDEGGCSSINLLDTPQLWHVELGDLVSLAAMHDDPEPSIERTSRMSDLLRQIGQLATYAVTVDDDEHPFLVMNCPYEGGRCPGSEDGECVVNLIPETQGHVDLGTLLLLASAHEDARFGVPVERLVELRQGWIIRQRAEIYTRETADGLAAGLASSRADLYGQLIGELDKAMARG
jgi:stringent starvation protein B